MTTYRKVRHADTIQTLSHQGLPVSGAVPGSQPQASKGLSVHRPDDARPSERSDKTLAIRDLPQYDHADLGLHDDDKTEDLRRGTERPRAAIAAEPRNTTVYSALARVPDSPCPGGPAPRKGERR